MNITLLGATGATGRILLPLLESEHQVTVLARRPQAVTVPRSNVAVITGDATSDTVVREAVRHAEAVISLVGPTAGEPTGLRSLATRTLVHAIQDVNPYARLVVVSTLAGQLRMAEGNWLRRLRHRLVPPPDGDYDRYLQERMVSDSGLAATVVRPAPLDDATPTGATVGRGPMPAGAVLHRADLARFLAQIVTQRPSGLEIVTVISTA